MKKSIVIYESHVIICSNDLLLIYVITVQCNEGIEKREKQTS